MNVAIIGCGNIAAVHAKALKQLEQTIVLAADHRLDAAEAFARQWGVKTATGQWQDALGEGVDCVHLCTPPTLHYEMARQVLLAGKHLICEKPLTLDAAQAKELAAIAEEKGLVAAVNFNVRFHEACARARDLIKSPAFGTVHLIHGSYLQEFHLLPADYMWRYIPELGGTMRAVTEIGSHWIDLARYLTGLEIEAVSATLGRFNPRRMLEGSTMYPPEHPTGKPVEVTTEDAAAVTFRFAGGALGSMLLSEVSPGRSNSVGIEISSGKAAVWWNSEDPYRLHHSPGKFKGIQTMVNAFGGGFPDTFAAFFTEVYRAVESGSRNGYPSFRDGAANAAVCEAIARSAANQSAWTEVLPL